MVFCKLKTLLSALNFLDKVRIKYTRHILKINYTLASMTLLSFTGLYLGIVTVMAAVGILLTVLILIIFHKEGAPSSSSLIVRITRVTAMCSCSAHLVRASRKNKVMPEPEVEEGGEKNPSSGDVYYDISYAVVATVLDRFCFITFTVVTFMINISFVIALIAGGKATDP